MSSSVDYRRIIQATFDSSIASYYEDVNVRDIVDLLQRDVRHNLVYFCGRGYNVLDMQNFS